jgi:hypothetical protein
MVDNGVDAHSPAPADRGGDHAIPASARTNSAASDFPQKRQGRCWKARSEESRAKGGYLPMVAIGGHHLRRR